MSRPPAATSVSKYLLKDAPAPIQESYGEVVGDRSPASRHRKLCQLGEVSLALLASHALSDYRSRRWQAPDEKVEEALERIRRFSLGHYTELLRLTRAEENPFVPPFENGRVDLPDCNRFAAASAGIEDAVEMEAQNIERAVEKRLAGSFKKLDWLGFWNQFVAYRNRSEGHSVSHQWPVDHPDYYEIITGRLEAALVEALTQESVVRLFDEYPIATLQNIQYENGSYVHQFAGEREGGIPFWAAITTDESVTDRWPADGWQAATDRSFILRRNQEGNHEIRALFTDLLTDEKPEPLETQKPEPEEAPHEKKKNGEAKDEAKASPAQSERRSPLCGRESEMQHAEAVLDRVGVPAESGKAPGGHAIMVAGAGGVGKTLLAKEISQRASKRGYEVVDIACEPFHEGMSLFPMREIVRQLSEQNALFDEVAAFYGSNSYQASMAELADDAAADPARRRDALVATFANVVYGRFADQEDQSEGENANRPVLALFDDLEHIDVGTADALICLLARMGEGPVVIVGAYQSDLIQKAETEEGHHPLQSVISTVQRRDSSLLLHLDPLDRSSMREATEAILDGVCKFPRRFYTRLYHETEGNPLFIREILRTLSKETTRGKPAKLKKIDGVWTLTAKIEQWEIPKTVEQAIGARLENLDSQQRTELEKAAVIGRRFAFSVMNELSRASEDELLDYLESFLSFDIIYEIEEGDETFEFAHGKIRDVLYQSMSSIRRRRIHSDVADVLLKTQPSTKQDWDALIGEHLYQARRYEEACPRLLQAARASMDMYAMPEAASQFQKAIKCGEKADLPSGETVQDLRMERGLALKLASEHKLALKVFEELIDDATDPLRQGWALNHFADIHQLNGNTTKALESYARCEEIARQQADDALLLEVAADLHELHDRQADHVSGLDAEKARKHREASEQYLDEQARLAEAGDDTVAKSRAFRNIAKRHRRAEEYEEALENYERGIELSDSRVATHKVQISYAKTLRYVGRHKEAKEVVERVLDWSLQTGARRSEGIARQYLGLLLFESSEPDSPERAEALDKLRTALHLQEEIDYERGRRESERLIGEWYARAGNWKKALHHFSLSTGKDTSDPSEIIQTVITQLRTRSEEARADALQEASKSMGG